jgi:hypothetical protein
MAEEIGTTMSSMAVMRIAGSGWMSGAPPL